jgi:REP element-mobilizing transposase RayT
LRPWRYRTDDHSANEGRLRPFPAQPVIGPAFTPGSAIVKLSLVLAREARSRAFPTFSALANEVIPMSRNYYSEINLHLTWRTKDSLPLLTPDVEPLAWRYVRQKIINTPGVFVHAFGGTDTHLHVAVTVPPTLLVSDLIGKIKGSSSHEVNQQLSLRGKVLQWQAGYGVVSFGTLQLDWVREYIRNQRDHHAQGRAVARLGRVTEMEEEP